MVYRFIDEKEKDKEIIALLTRKHMLVCKKDKLRVSKRFVEEPFKVHFSKNLVLADLDFIPNIFKIDKNEFSEFLVVNGWLK